MFGDAKAPKEPVGDQRIGQKASPESVERKQSRTLAMIFLLLSSILAPIAPGASELPLSTAGERNN
jgi:hypothetical protein